MDQRALEVMRTCETVIDAGVKIGSYNRRMEDLIQEAKRLGKWKRSSV